MTRDEAQTLWQLVGRDAALAMLGPFERDWLKRRAGLYGNIGFETYDESEFRAREFIAWIALMCERREIQDEVA